MSKFSVKKPFTVFVGIVLCLILGYVSFTKMTTDLLPSISLPYVIVVTTYPGASPEKVESDITEPLEASLGTVNGVENVSSTSNENYSMVSLEFTDGTNMDSAMVKLSTAVNELTLPDTAGKPMLMEISPDMMATMVVSVDYEDMDIYELTEFVDETIIPYFERQSGVASVSETGMVEKSVEIRLNQKKIDKLNDKLLKHVNKSLTDAKQKIDDSKSELSKAKKDLASQKSQLESEQKKQSGELAKFSKQMDEAVATQKAYEAQLNSLQAAKKALEAEKGQYEQAYKQVNDALAAMLVQIEEQMPEDAGIPMEMLPTSIEDALANNGAKYAILEQILTAAGQEELLEQVTLENLKALQEGMDTRIPEINTELANLKTEIATADAILKQINQGVSKAVEQYEAVETGKITAAAAFGTYNAQIASGESAIAEGESQLKDAEKSYKDAAKTARKNANLDALLNMETLSQMLAAQNFDMPAGYINEGETQYLLKVGNEFGSLKELKKTLLCDIDGVGEVRLKDVAVITVIDNAGDAYAKVNGNDAVLLSISKSSTAGTSDVSKACKNAIEELEKEHKGLRITPMMDQGDYIELIVHSVLSNLIYGAILAIIVLALFLKDVRPTIVVAFSIPLSVLFAIVLMYFTNITLNIISLSGLALGVGMLVDNSIVVIENIYRLRSMGVSAARAAVMGANQVAGAIAASTLTTICVFLPIVFTGGMTRELLQDMALTIGYSLVASLLVALTVVPSMSATLLRKEKEHKHRLFDFVMDLYEAVLRFCLRFKIIPISLAVGLLAFSGWKALDMGIVMIPEMGGNQMTVSVTAPEDSTDQEAFELADQILEKIQKVEGVDVVGAMSGGGGMGLTASDTGFSGSFTFYVILKEEAAEDNTLVADCIDKELSGLSCEYSVSKSNMDISALSGNGLEVDISGSDTEELQKISQELMKLLGEVEGFGEITNGQEDADTQLKIVVDKDKAMKYSLTVAQIYGELSKKLQTDTDSTTLSLKDGDYQVTIEDTNDSITTENLMDYKFEVTIKEEDGSEKTEKHKLKEFAKLKESLSMSSISRENQARYIAVHAETKEGYNTTLLSRKVEKKLKGFEVPDGYTVEIVGESQSVNDMMSDMFLMILLAVAFIYLIMVSQFQSLLSPFIVLFTIPLAFTGGLFALLITGEDISMIAMMGFLILAGVVVNNGIVFVDYANQLRISGMEKREALVETGRTRMRPILMTAMTTILAMSTMALSKSAEAAMGKGMAIVTIGGLAYATLMTLFIVPVLYDLIFRRALRTVDLGDEDTLDEDI